MTEPGQEPLPDPFRKMLLEALGDMAPEIADEISAAMDDPAKADEWLQAHGFGPLRRGPDTGKGKP
jgi:hypothetical protein